MMKLRQAKFSSMIAWIGFVGAGFFSQAMAEGQRLANAGTYEVGVIPTLGGKNSLARDITESYMIVGESENRSGDLHGFASIPWLGIFDMGVLPGGNFTSAYAINKDALAVGTGTIPDSSGTTMHLKAFRWTPASGIKPLRSLVGSGDSIARDVNNLGEIVGVSKGKAALWINDRVFDLGTLGGKTSEASSVNEKGWIVGSSEMKDGTTHAFVHFDGSMRDLGTLGGKNSFGIGIDEKGRVSGSSETKSGAVHTFTWSEADGMVDRDDGKSSTLASHSSLLSLATGGGLSQSGSLHAILWDWDGSTFDLGVLAPMKNSYGNAVNDGGMVVGYSFTGEDRRATFWKLTRDEHLPAQQLIESLD